LPSLYFEKNSGLIYVCPYMQNNYALNGSDFSKVKVHILIVKLVSYFHVHAEIAEVFS
jgi:hypothetical protein